jgi:hypothetical protein
MPEPDYVWLPREDILHFEEIERLVDVFTSLGVDKVRLTGGEPLLRRDLPDLIRRLASRSAIRDLAMTTNGVLLAAQPRYASPGSIPQPDPVRRTRSCAGRDRRGRSTLSRTQAGHRRDSRRQ